MTNQRQGEGQADQIATTAHGKGDSLTDEQISAVQDFVEQLGGIENARRVIAALNEQKLAA